MKRNLLLIFLASLFLGACTALSGHHTPEAYKAPPESAAFLIGSISVKTEGQDRSLNNSSKILFRRKGDQAIGEFQISQSFLFPSEFDFEDENRSGSLIMMPLVPGDYELTNVQFYYNNGQVERYWSAEQDFSVPFRVEAGQAHYIGEFLAFGRKGRNIIGIKVPAGGYFIKFDSYERDLPLLLQKFPELKGKDVVRLDMKPNVPPFLRTAE